MQARQTASKPGSALTSTLAFAGCMVACGCWSAAAADSAPAPVAAVGGIAAAENSIQTSQGRLFVSSDGALYELTGEAGGSWTKSALPAKFKDGSSHACYYLGLAEYADTLYSVCTENFYDIFAPKHLMGLDLRPGAAAQLREVGPLSEIGSPNGLGSDGAGHLYYANFGIFYPGSIHRITLSGRWSLSEDVPVLHYRNLNPNGLKVSHGSLYVSGDPILDIGVSQLIRYRLVDGRPTDAKLIYQAFATFDDFALLEGGGILLAEFLWGQLVDIDEDSGKLLHTLPIKTPTSVQVITPGTGAESASSLLLVTERGGNQAQLLTNPWGLEPRD